MSSRLRTGAEPLAKTACASSAGAPARVRVASPGTSVRTAGQMGNTLRTGTARGEPVATTGPYASAIPSTSRPPPRTHSSSAGERRGPRGRFTTAAFLALPFSCWSFVAASSSASPASGEEGDG